LDCKTTTFLGDKERSHGLTGPSPGLPQKQPRQHEKSREFYTDQALAANCFEDEAIFTSTAALWSSP
jgi:hypothetical protein